MNIKEFAEHWMAINIPESGMYGNRIKELVFEIAETIYNQPHSGASESVLVFYAIELLEAYRERP